MTLKIRIDSANRTAHKNDWHAIYPVNCWVLSDVTMAERRTEREKKTSDEWCRFTSQTHLNTDKRTPLASQSSATPKARDRVEWDSAEQHDSLSQCPRWWTTAQSLHSGGFETHWSMYHQHNKSPKWNNLWLLLKTSIHGVGQQNKRHFNKPKWCPGQLKMLVITTHGTDSRLLVWNTAVTGELISHVKCSAVHMSSNRPQSQCGVVRLAGSMCLDCNTANYSKDSCPSYGSEQTIHVQRHREPNRLTS